MFVKIPFESTIEFKTNIAEITKMSLEHEFNINDSEILGNFYISGEYKVHSVSINTEPFKYTLPFTVDLRSDINRESLEFNIEDFSYDVLDNKKLHINIEYSLKGEEIVKEKEELFEKVDEKDIREELNYIDDFLEEKGDDNNEKNDRECEKEIRKNEEEDKKIEENEVIDNISKNDDTYVTYHIHIASSEDTMESISKNYKIDLNVLKEYNNVDSISTGDKLVIPEIDE